MPHEEWIKTVVGFGASTLGFLVALLVNSYVELLRDKRAHRMMLRAIKAEADNNKVILKDSFEKYYRDGLVLRELSLGVAVQCCTSPLIIKHSRSSEIEVLNAYLRNLRLANRYREKAEHLRIDPTGKASQQWLKGIIDYWGPNLKECRGSIEQVLMLVES